MFVVCGFFLDVINVLSFELFIKMLYPSCYCFFFILGIDHFHIFSNFILELWVMTGYSKFLKTILNLQNNRYLFLNEVMYGQKK